MIEFNVILSEESKRYLLKEQHKGMVFLSFFIGIIFFIPLVVITFLWRYAAICTIPAMVIVGFTILYLCSRRTKQFKETFDESLPNSIIIDGGKIETLGLGELSYKCKSIIDIKEIRDMGTFYAVIFYFPSMDRRFICQKDLLVQGTIEEFEEIFKNKIVRKYK